MIVDFVSQNREYRYAQARERLRLQWAALENQLTAAYLQSQTRTRNWTSKISYLNDVTDVSSPTQPRTAFSITLLQLYHFVWQTSVCAATSFFEGARRDLTQPFSSTTHLYSRILVLSKCIVNHGLQLTSKDLWAGRCGRCFGPKMNEIKESDNEPDIIVCMDGNFQHRHNKLASKDNPDESHYPDIFVRPSEIAKHNVSMDPPPRANNQDDDDPCGEAHKTANDTRNSSTWDQCDDTGLFALACRHDVPLLMANIYQSGEKMYYPLALIQSLLDDFPNLRVGILYDIGCHLDKHIKKKNKLPEYQRRIVLGTSVFHAYVHSWGCQLQYNPRFLQYWGLSDGEGLERLWSDLTPLIARLRTSTRQHRLQAIASRLAWTRGIRCPILISQGNSTRQSFSGLSGSQKDIITSPRRRTLRFGKSSSLEGCCVFKTTCIVFGKLDEDTQLELRAFDRLDRFQDLATQIAEQRRKVGISDMMTDLPEDAADSFLKVWFAKTEVRTRFLALRAEQWPLDPENRVGGSSRLGTHEKERIMVAIERRTRTVKKTLSNYNRLARVGMRALARLHRGKEEIRRLGWEVRRAMRWATREHERLWIILNQLRVLDLNRPSQHITHFLTNEALGSLSIGGKVDVAKGLLHNAFVRISTLTIYWDFKAMSVMMRTPAQLGDLELMTSWKSQLYRINDLRSKGYASIKLGDFENLFEPNVQLHGHPPEAQNPPQDRLPVIQEVEEVEEEQWQNGIEEEWENRIDGGMLINMMANVGLERDLPPPILAF
ncbi:hypothetical protein DFH28DRAFT_905432 [Melampsora americana]|nr:hypothetical protein DFH28DRAFT_919062 [Melampsora americana]KAH9809391.1 hypothetical protein DFH28DRAFT_905432 [Melampsora americana]